MGVYDTTGRQWAAELLMTWAVMALALVALVAVLSAADYIFFACTDPACFAGDPARGIPAFSE